MESDTERGVGSFGNDGEELSPMMTITSLNRGMDSIVAKAGTLSTLENIKGITSFERKFKRAIDTTPFGCYPSMLLDVYEGTVGWSETDMRFVEKGWRRVHSRAEGIDENVVECASGSVGRPGQDFSSQGEAKH